MNEDFCWRCGKRAVLECVEMIGFLCAPCRIIELSPQESRDA